MDITLIKTFLEVAATGSFVSASDRLYVTQSAVSLRILRLEESLGRPLFKRSKAGAVLTDAGREFEHYALSLVKTWEEARQQIAIPEGFEHSLTLGAQYSLWPRLGFRWIDAMQQANPRLSLRAEVGMPDRLTRFLIEGVVQSALMYTPQLRPGLDAEEILEDDLVLAASWPDPTLDLADRYVFVDWGPEFVRAHGQSLPGLTNSGLTMVLGSLTAEFVVNRQLAAYLPARSIARYLDAGRMHLVPDAPRFRYPIWSVWREDLDPGLAELSRSCLANVVADIDRLQDKILDHLADISALDGVETLGEGAIG